MSNTAPHGTRPPDATPARPPGQDGFSLVEMLISVVLTGILGAAIVGVLMDQSAFYQTNSRLVTANKSLRGTADRMSTELRTVRQGDVVAAEPDSVTVRYGVAHGVVCHTGATTVYLYMHRVPEVQPNTVRYLEPRFQGSWQTGLVWTDLQNDGSQTCASHGAPSGMPADHYQEVTSWPASIPEVGTLVYGTDRVSYHFVDQGDRIVLMRNDRMIAGPFQQSESYFRYYAQDGSEVTGSNLDDIAYVRIDATAEGHDPNQRYEGDRAIDLRVPFRN